jgi:hypothetical protein
MEPKRRQHPQYSKKLLSKSRYVHEARAKLERQEYTNDWGFKLADITVQAGEVIIWHGGLDVNVPAPTAPQDCAVD